MSPSALERLAPDLQRRGRLVTLLSRLTAILLGGLGVVLLWDSPRLRRGPLILVGAVYLVFMLGARLWLRRDPRSRGVKIVHDVADGMATGLAAFFAGGLDSPFWLLLYPHAVAVSVRGGLGFGLAVGLFDALIVVALAATTPGGQFGELNALTLLWCAAMAGMMSSHLKQVRGRLSQTNLDLSTANEQLSATIEAHEAARAEQELAMDRLRDSEERYRRLVEGIQDGVVIVRDGRIVYANQVFAEMVGQAQPALLGSDVLDLLVGDERQEIAARYRQWQDSHALSAAFESRVRGRGGDTLLVSVRAGAVEYEGGQSVIATLRDITRQRLMEHEFREHAQRLAAINEIANAVNLSLTIEDILRVAADETRRLVPYDRLTIALVDDDDTGVELVAVGTGASRQRAVFERIDIAWALRRPTLWCESGDEPGPPHVQELLADAELRAVATLPLMSKERAIGSLNLGRLRPQPFSTWDLAVAEPVARHIGIALDNARLLEAVRRRGHELESLLDVGRGILERLELGEILPGVVRSVNQLMGTHYCMLLLKDGDDLRFGAQEGLEAEVVDTFQRLRVGESLSGWVAREGRPLAVLDMRQDPRAGFKETAERFGYRSYLCVPLRRGTEVLGTLEVITKQPRRFRSDEQEVMAAFADQAAIAIDHARLFRATRTQLVQLVEVNRRLEELDHMREQYLRNVSHEFRTPLTVIKGYAEYLLDSAGPSPQSVREVMRVIVESCDRVIDLVDTLLEVSRVEQSPTALRVEEMDLRDVVVHSVDALRRAGARKGSVLDLELAAEPVTVQGDAGLLDQVVRKLVDNALKYSPPGSRVVVRAQATHETALIEVEDSGIGIPPEHLGHIFEKFYMVDGGISRSVGGTGVGLYLVREIVRLHEGDVDVRSRPGQGSVFSVRLPRRLRQPRVESALA